MTHNNYNTNSSYIDCLAEQESHPTIPYQDVVEKVATENSNKNINNLSKLLKSKKRFIIGSLNMQTLQKLWKIPELMPLLRELNKK